MAEVFRNPGFEEVETPWKPQPIAWRYPSDVSDHTATFRGSIEAQIKDQGKTHLVREVRIFFGSLLHPSNSATPDSFLASIAQIEDELALVDEQLTRLEETTEMSVAPTEWHVFGDPNGYTRTLARVEIIDGLMPATMTAVRTIDRGMSRYSQTTGRVLRDVNDRRQYIEGVPRGNPLAKKCLYLVDIEPLLTDLY